MKILLILFVVIGCAFIGRLFSKSLEIRIESLKEFYRDIQFFKSLVVDEGRELLTALNAMGRKNERFIEHIYIDTKIRIEKNPGMDISSAFENSMVERQMKFGIEHLKAEDIELFSSFGRVLSTIRHSAGKNSIDVYLKELEMHIDVQQEEQKKKTKIYNRMGLLVGLFIGIILL